jgi:hypothetical protein
MNPITDCIFSPQLVATTTIVVGGSSFILFTIVPASRCVDVFVCTVSVCIISEKFFCLVRGVCPSVVAWCFAWLPQLLLFHCITHSLVVVVVLCFCLCFIRFCVRLHIIPSAHVSILCKYYPRCITLLVWRLLTKVLAPWAFQSIDTWIPFF